jgi:hypothetical protein
MKNYIIYSFLLLLLPFSVVAQEKNKKEGPLMYMPYSKTKDHMVVGIEIHGYHMRYDIAQHSNIFMVLLPDGYKDMRDTPVYFAIDTTPLLNFTVKETFNNDIEALKKMEPGLNVIKTYDGSKTKKAGECYGAKLKHPMDGRPFPNEIFYVCKNKSNKYAIIISLGARNKEKLAEHYNNFIKWVNAPQMVTGYKVNEHPKK